MSGDSTKKKTLRPSWKQFLLSYVYSILLIPVFGIGLISLYFVWRRHHQFRYEVTDTGIKAIDGTYSQHFDLENINSIEVDQNWLTRQMDVGSLLIETETRQMKLLGINDPEEFRQLLEKAVQAAKKRKREAEKTKPREPSHKPGEMERINYLTGLWQQGLISDEEFQQEKS